MNREEHGGRPTRSWPFLLLFFAGMVIAFLSIHRLTHPPHVWPQTPRLALRPRAGLNLSPSRLDDVQFLHNLRRSGVVWVRVQIPWKDIEPKSGEYRWDVWDRRVQNVHSAGLHLIALLNTTPPWARATDDASNPFAPPSDPQTMARFARTFAARYRRAVRYYQVWDEPNIAPHWGNRETDPLGYVYLLKAVSTAIRSVDPEAVILSAGLAPTLDPGRLNRNDLAYLRELYTLGADAWFDVLAWEPYGFDRPPEEAPSPHRLNFRRYELARAVMREFGDDDTPIWFVAFGWNACAQKTPWKTVSRQEQAEYLRRAYMWVMDHAAYVGPMLWTHAYPIIDPAAPEWGFALWTPDGFPQPAWKTLQTVAALPAADLGIHPLSAEPPVILSFWGTAVALKAKVGPRWDILWISVDGKPVPRLPRDAQGRSYLNLYRPRPATLIVPLAEYLPHGLHTLVIQQGPGDPIWAFESLIIFRPSHVSKIWLIILGLGVLGGLFGLFVFWRRGYRFPIIVPCRFSSLVLYSLMGIAFLMPFATRYIRFGPWLMAPPVLGLGVTGLFLGWSYLNNEICLREYTWDLKMIGAWGMLFGVFAALWIFGDISWGIFWTRVGAPFVVFLGVVLVGGIGGNSQQATRTTLLTTPLILSGTLLAITTFLLDAPKLISLLHLDIPPFPRLQGFFGSPNHLALILLRILPFALVQSESDSRPTWARASVLLMGLALALTQSRSVWLLGMPVLILALGLRRPRRIMWLGTSFLIGGLLLFFRGEETLRHRWLIWQGTWALIKAHPWLGIGIGMFPHVYPMYARPTAWREPLLYHAHNVLLHTAAAVGIPAALGFFYLLARALWPPPQSPMTRAAWASLLAGLACGLVDAFWALDDLAYLTAWAWGLLYVSENENPSENLERE